MLYKFYLFVVWRLFLVLGNYMYKLQRRWKEKVRSTQLEQSRLSGRGDAKLIWHSSDMLMAWYASTQAFDVSWMWRWDRDRPGLWVRCQFYPLTFHPFLWQARQLAWWEWAVASLTFRCRSWARAQMDGKHSGCQCGFLSTLAKNCQERRCNSHRDSHGEQNCQAIERTPGIQVEAGVNWKEDWKKLEEDSRR